jgi:hypothetical protein
VKRCTYSVKARPATICDSTGIYNRLCAAEPQSIFKSFDGGVKSKTTNRSYEVYIFGLIDCLSCFDFIKWVEKEIKSNRHGLNLPNASVDREYFTLPRMKSEVSVEEPERYADRLVEFIDSIVE